MGNHAKPSVARTRLSTLAVTTSLGVAGAGMMAGTANATVTPVTATATPAAADGTDATLTVNQGAAIPAVSGGTTVHLDAHTSVLGTGAGAGTALHYTFTCDTAAGAVAPSNLGTGTADCVYAAPGTYHPSVMVDDHNTTAANGQSSVGVTVTVAAPPTAGTISAKQIAPFTIAVNLGGGTADTAASPLSYVIDWGDGAGGTPDNSPAFTAISPAPTHKYTAASTYTVKVTATDALGVSATNQTTIKVDNTQPAPPLVLRGSGNDRYLTGIAVSGHRWADKGATSPDSKGRITASAVVLATGGSFPDALAGVPLAKAKNGPLLLTDGSAASMNPAVLTEIQRILPQDKSHTIYVLGGVKAISANIEAQLNTLGYNVMRLSGSDRFGTALDIAKVGMGDPDHIVVARGDNGVGNNGFADALAAGPYAADVLQHGGAAILLSNGSAFDPNTQNYVESKINNSKIDVVAIGGPAVTAVAALPGAVPLHQDPTTKNLVGNFAAAKGANRYDTAKIVAAAFNPNDVVGVATGLQFADALTGGAYMASVDGPLLLTDPAGASPEMSAALANVAQTTPEVDIFGGEKAVSVSVADSILAAVKQTTIGQF